MLLLPEYSLIGSSNLASHTCNFKALRVCATGCLRLLPLLLHFPRTSTHLYTCLAIASHIAMAVIEFNIGIETEGFWKGKAGFNLPGNDVDPKIFAEALVLCYNKIRKDLLRADFSHGSHPGHPGDSDDERNDDERKWIVALDHAIGDLDLDRPPLEGRTYSAILSGVTIFIILTTIQIPSNLSLRNCHLARIVSGERM